MSTSQHSPAPGSGPVEDAGGAALVAAMEAAPAAIWCLAGPGLEPVWVNARARALGTARGDLPSVDGRHLTELADVVARTGRPETVCGVLGSDGPTATVVLQPLQVAGRPGVLLLLEAERAGVERGTGSEAQARVVEQVQHSLLPPALPLLPDVRLSGSYHRASSVRAAGGDWYDAVPLGRGRLALVVGDAVGHGVPAAGAMSRLRGAMRSVALRDPSPVAVVAALDAFAGQMEDVEGASVFYAVLEAATGRLTYAAAGHPAPLVVHPDGSSSFLPLAPRPPLGSLPGAPTVAATAELEQGATLVLFSDGAVSASGAPPVEGLARLADAARAVLADPGPLGGGTSSGLAAAIAAHLLTPGEQADDLAVLVAHRCAEGTEPLHLDLSAVPASLPAVRRRLGAWLTALGMGEQDRVGVMVAAGEAAANAVEHAYRGLEPGRVSVTATVDVDGVLTVTVRDEGRWRPPDRDPGDRGRGLMIMRQLVDGVVLQGEQGTTVTLSMRLRRGPDEDEERSAGASAAEVAVDRTGERPVVRVAGAVDPAGAEQMRIRLLEASHGGTGRVELDLTAVTLFSSAAVRVVLAVARIAGDEGWVLLVHAPEGGVTRHILEISGLAGLVELR
ncbi:anti-anti-sigma factor [Geodermatophilus sp. TF02-6]|uniref:SpoIIE family protein phosphatase n=1 Tax=Geodermatophilus sp. TF02-6 TaxID=2250575 RepID=UPI000DEBBD79|nr:SpoIIE family protein phosphatase [Geodermatophilus sp. TF02-6]RBY82966.1 anti-anti-sigma factor [Geodermatophilus sp. TF02-6]